MHYTWIAMCILCGCLLVNADVDVDDTDEKPVEGECDENCAGGCLQKGSGKCDRKCKSGYLLNTETFICGSVSPCSSDVNCIRCQPNGNCYLCKPGYKLSMPTLECVLRTDQESVCDRFCTSGCGSSGSENCDRSCQPGFKLVGNKCLYCDPNCDLASGCEQQGQGKCDSICSDGYMLNTTDYKCKQCAPNCISGCDKRGFMRCDKECAMGFGLNADNLCIPCDPNCDPTSGCKTNGPSSCDTACKPGFTMNKIISPPTCDKCDANCINGCDNAGAGFCDGTCKSGFVYHAATKTCKRCASNCASGCAVKGPNLCDSACKQGYWFDPAKFACYQCDQHCDRTIGTCSSPGTCNNKCMEGFTLRNGRCFK